MNQCDTKIIPVFPTPLPPITAILMTRLWSGGSAAGHSAMVVMLWIRRILLLPRSFVEYVQGKHSKKKSSVKSGHSQDQSRRDDVGEVNPAALVRTEGDFAAEGEPREAYIALERRSRLIGRRGPCLLPLLPSSCAHAYTCGMSPR